MNYISVMLSAALLTWLGSLAGLVALRVLMGNIRSSGFLSDNPGSEVAADRVVAMAVFPAVVLAYVISALNTDLSGPSPSLPDVPESVIALLTGSNGLYLAGKINRRASGGHS